MAEDKSTEVQPQEEQAPEQPSADTTTQSLIDTTPDTPAEQPTDRPEWLPEKFKTPEELSKSYVELEKKISDQPRAPEEYDYGFVKDMGLEMNEDQTKQANDVFKNYNLTQEQMKGMMALYSDAVHQMQEQYAPVQTDMEAETQNLKNTWSKEYDSKIQSVRNFSKNLKKETLNAPLANTAEGLQLIHDAMLYRQGPNPIAQTGVAPTVTRNDLLTKAREMRNDDRFKLPQGDSVGDAWRNEIYRLYQQMDRVPVK